MDKKTQTTIRNRFERLREQRFMKLGEPWTITEPEWIAFFSSPEMKAEILKPRAHSLMRRKNAVLPWSMDNIEFSDKVEFPITRRAKRKTEGSDLEAAFRMMATDEADENYRLLTPKQWVAELRENSPSD